MMMNPLYPNISDDDATGPSCTCSGGDATGDLADHSYFYSPLFGTHHTIHAAVTRRGAQERWNLSPLHAYWSSITGRIAENGPGGP